MAQASSDNVPHLSAGFEISADGDMREAVTEQGTGGVSVLATPVIGSTVEAQIDNNSITLVLGDGKGNPLYGIQMQKAKLKPKVIEVS